jgi:hypothetical protein
MRVANTRQPRPELVAVRLQSAHEADHWLANLAREIG